MEDGVEGGLTSEEGAEIISHMAEMGLDGIEISGGIQATNSKKGIKSQDREAYFLPLAKIARQKTNLPIILVGGMRSKAVMDNILESGDADFIALCRPLINEPGFPGLLKDGKQSISGCLSSNNCWPKNLNEGIACKCPKPKR